MGEDLVLVQGQQARLEAGGDTWANPVSYDKLAVRYRWGRAGCWFFGAAAPQFGGDEEHGTAAPSASPGAA
jgi:hypothetical protein